MINIKKIKPMFTAIITTMDKYEKDEVYPSGIIDIKRKAGEIKEYQKVIAVGSLVRDIKVGDLVCIDPIRYAVKKHQEGSLKDGVISDNPIIYYNFELVTIDNEAYLYLQDRDIKYIIEEYEDIEEYPNKDSNIILPTVDIVY